MALSSPMKLTSSASFSPSIRISLRLKIHQAQAKNFCRVLDIRVLEIVIAYLPQSVFLQNIGKALCEIAQLDQFPDLIDIDIVSVLGAVRPSAQLAVLLLLCFQAMQQFLKRRDKGQTAVAGLRLCAILLDDLALAINGYLRDRMTNGDRLFLEVDSV